MYRNFIIRVVCITSQCFVGDCKDYVRRSQKKISLFLGILLLNPLMPTEWSMLQTLLSISSRHYPLWIGRANLVLRAVWTSRYHHDDTVVLGAGLKLKLNGKFVKSSMLPWFNHYYTQGVIVLGHNLPCYSKVRSKQEFQLIMKSSNGLAGGQWMAARQVSFQGPENQQQMPQPLTFMEPIPSYGCFVVYLSEDH